MGKAVGIGLPSHGMRIKAQISLRKTEFYKFYERSANIESKMTERECFNEELPIQFQRFNVFVGTRIAYHFE